jgi:hypothetical protein
MQSRRAVARLLVFVAALLSTLSSAQVAHAKKIGRLPDEFVGCYRDTRWGDGASECRQPTAEEVKQYFCPNGGILVDATTWTTFEDWTCDIKSVRKRRGGVYIEMRRRGSAFTTSEFWQLRTLNGMTLLIRTDTKKVTSEIFVRCKE